MDSYTEALLDKVREHARQPTARNGVAWPERHLERWVLAWLECRADDGYQWPRWAVAQEVTDATFAFYQERAR